MSEDLLRTTLAFLFFLVIGAVLLVVIQKAIRLIRERHQEERRSIHQKPLMAFLCGDASALELLRAQRPIDRNIIVAALMESGENFAGEFRPRICLACEELGFVEEYLQRIRSRKWWVRAEAAYRLGLMGSPRAEPDLITALDDTVPEVRLMAIRSLAALNGARALPPILEHFREISSWGLLELSDIMFRLGTSCVPILLETLNRPESRAHLVAIDILGQLNDNRAVSHLILLLTSPHTEIRIRTVKALGLIADPDSIPSVCRRADDPAWEVRLMVASAIGRAGGPQQIPTLTQLLNDPERRVRVEAAEALIEMGEPGQIVLRQARLGSDPFTRHLAEQFLRPRVFPPEARPA